MPTLPLMDVFRDLPDPRRKTKNKLHYLNDILVLATSAIIAGAESWDSIATYAQSKKTFFQRFLDLPNGIPSADTFERVLAKLDSQAFAQAFGKWMASACEAAGLKPIAVDGKSARSAPQNTATGCLHVVSAWATENRLFLGQVAVEDGSNEIAAIPELLKLLDLKGSLVTIDAAGTQVENAKLIKEKGGEYLLSVKNNQPLLFKACEQLFTVASELQTWLPECTTQDSGHGRIEERNTLVIRTPRGLPKAWSSVKRVIQVNRVREVNGVSTNTTQYYVCSAKLSADELSAQIRGHWKIENSLHWTLDVVFHEDDSRIRAGHAGENLALIRRVAVSLLSRIEGRQKRETTRTKRLRAGWDDEFMLEVLLQFQDT